LRFAPSRARRPDARHKWIDVRNATRPAFSEIRQWLKSLAARAVSDPWNTIQPALDQSTARNVAGFFRHCGYATGLLENALANEQRRWPSLASATLPATLGSQLSDSQTGLHQVRRRIRAFFTRPGPNKRRRSPFSHGAAADPSGAPGGRYG
jgi:hypothetical protein